MTVEELHRNHLEKLPNIVLIPWHREITSKSEPTYPLCGKREIFCGHKLQNKESAERKYIRTSGPFFDIGEVLTKLSEDDQKIDLIFSMLEVNNTCFPKNLSIIKCPKLAFLGDTHHSKYSISSLIKYVKREGFTHIFTNAQPAHLHFFYEAGFTNSAFYPRPPLNFETVKNKKPGVVYIGKKWKSSHPRRSRMAQFLEKELPKKNIPFYWYNRLSKTNWRKVLMSSKMIALSSLNGQFTPQIYNCLSAEALCLVDELSTQSFLHQFFEPGKHLITWSKFEDLLEKIIYYYNHPAEAEAIAKAGKLQVEKNFATSENMACTFSEFVFDDKIDPRFLAIQDRRCQQKRVESPEYFNARVRLYENIQELHRIHESLALISLTEKNLKPTSDLADLPRLKITHAFLSDKIKNEADLYFHNVGVSDQIKTTFLNKIQELNHFNVGLLETLQNQDYWVFLVKSISTLLKSNSLLWVLGELTSFQNEILKREGFKKYIFKNDSKTQKIKNFSRKFCFQFWKMGLYPLPYLTLKPSMETTPNLNVFLRGWQPYIPFIY